MTPGGNQPALSTQTFQCPEIFPLARCLPIWPSFPPAYHARHFPSARLRECHYLLAENAFRHSFFPLLETTKFPGNSFQCRIICHMLTM